MLLLWVSSMAVVLTACSGSSSPNASRTLGQASGSPGPTFNEAAQVYAALVDRLEQEDRVLHATVVSTQSENPEEANSEFWVDGANDLARKHDDITNILNIPYREVFVIDGQEYMYFGPNDPVQRDAPNCEGITAPALSLLLRCEGVAGSSSSLGEQSGQKVSIVTSGSYGEEVGNKPWTRTLTVDAESLMPISLESDLWAVLNNEPYQVHESWTYTTEFVDREDLQADLFDLP